MTSPLTLEATDVPVDACRLAVEPSIGSNGDNAKTAPIKMLARSGEPVMHWYWGNVVHDLEGMVMNSKRLPIDYDHDTSEVIGYLNHFSIESGDLVVSGALTPFKEDDRASEVIYKHGHGVPYEASINFAGEPLELEELDIGETATVNGRLFAGPGVIIRKWPLRGVALTPYGADQNSRAEFNFASADKIPANRRVVKMTSEVVTANDVEEVTGDEAQAVTVEATDSETDTEEVEANREESSTVDTETDATTELSSASPNGGQRFLDAFGDQGGVWFAQGLSFDDAQTKFNAALLSENETLKAENAKLKQRLQNASADGELEAVTQESEADETAFKANPELVRQGVPERVQRLAASRKAPRA